MVQAEKQKEVFLSLCGQHDYNLLTGKEAMTQADFERITYITTVLGYSSYTQELISEHLEMACKEAERTDREFDILKGYPEYYEDENVYEQIDTYSTNLNTSSVYDSAEVEKGQYVTFVKDSVVMLNKGRMSAVCADSMINITEGTSLSDGESIEKYNLYVISEDDDGLYADEDSEIFAKGGYQITENNKE